MRTILLMLAWAAACAHVVTAQPARVLYITHSAGFVHDSIAASVEAFTTIGNRTGKFSIVATADVSQIRADNLRNFSAVLFFTSGELALDASQRSALLDFVRNGGGFGGFHSATDTLYSWPEYGDLIGGYFDGHPWTQSARILTEGAAHPATRGLPSPWTLTEEYYQFRAFSRDRVRVLMRLDPASVDLNAPGAHPGTTDFPLAWTRSLGKGRMYYSALGHFSETWQNPEVRSSLEGAMSWLLGEVSIEAAGNAATGQPLNVISRGSLITIYGSNLTGALAESGTPPSYAPKLAGSTVRIEGQAIPLLYASPDQINALVPKDLTAASGEVSLEVTTESRAPVTRSLRLAEATPGIFAATATPAAITIWATGLGPDSRLTATVARQPANVLYAGDAPGWPGLSQINLSIPAGLSPGAQTVEIFLNGSAAAWAGVVLPSVM